MSDGSADVPDAAPSAGTRTLGALALTPHALVALVWWWIAPQGFPLAHPRFWANTALPWVLVAAVVGSLVLGRSRPALRSTLLVALASAWGAAAIVAWVIFPVSAPRALCVVGLIVALVLGLIARAHRAGSAQPIALRVGLIALTLVPGALAGALVPFAQRGPDADTHPSNVAIAPGAFARTDAPSSLILGAVSVDASGAEVDTTCGGLSLRVEPLLAFHSVSPDRGWTLFTHSALHEPQSPRRLASWEPFGVRSARVRYGGSAESLLVVRADDGGAVATIDAYSSLPREVYSHLNTFARVLVEGRSDLALEFSPAPGRAIDAVESDYPIGRPARIAYLDAAGTFHVVQASSGEKGPFEPLAAGPLARRDALTITLVDRGRPACRLVFGDWAAQAATQLSPTAGWGLPVNAIEFRRVGGTAPHVYIALTLAGTSVGRGWDSVGHAAGTYRNRVRVESLR